MPVLSIRKSRDETCDSFEGRPHGSGLKPSEICVVCALLPNAPHVPLDCSGTGVRDRRGRLADVSVRRRGTGLACRTVFERRHNGHAGIAATDVADTGPSASNNAHTTGR